MSRPWACPGLHSLAGLASPKEETIHFPALPHQPTGLGSADTGPSQGPCMQPAEASLPVALPKPLPCLVRDPLAIPQHYLKHVLIQKGGRAGVICLSVRCDRETSLLVKRKAAQSPPPAETLPSARKPTCFSADPAAPFRSHWHSPETPSKVLPHICHPLPLPFPIYTVLSACLPLCSYQRLSWACLPTTEGCRPHDQPTLGQ